MRRISPFSLIGLGFLLMVGGYVWHTYFSQTSQPSTVAPAEKPVTVATVLQAMPAEPDFSRQANDTLQAVVLQETTVLQPQLEYLKSLTQFLSDAESALKQSTSTSCDVIKVMTERIGNLGPSPINTDSISQETIQDVRDTFDATATEASSKYYEQWGNWGIQLDEALPEDNKKQKKAVEKFQKQFGDITDDYQNDLDDAIGILRKQADSSLDLSRVALQQETHFSSDIKTWLTAASLQCAPGGTDASLSPQAFRSQLTDWEMRTKHLISVLSDTKTEIMHLPVTLLPPLESKTKAETQALHEALTTMQASLK